MLEGLRRLTGRSAFLALIAALAVGYGASAASAAESVVSAGGCILGNGGQVTRPAGSTITIRFAVFEVNRGVVRNFLNAQTTSVVVNGGQPIDLSRAYSEPTLQPDATWITSVLHPTGVLLANPGDTLTFSLNVSVDHRLAEVTNGLNGFAPGPPTFIEPGTYFSGTCTVTAV